MENKQLARDLKLPKEEWGRLVPKLEKLQKIGVIIYEKPRWNLTNKGRELCNYLFENL